MKTTATDQKCRLLFHYAGGVLSDSLLQQQTPAAVRSVFAPKAAGITNLSLAANNLASKGLIAFSSVAAFIGSAGQGSYAAANACMDEAVSCLAQQGLTGMNAIPYIRSHPPLTALLAILRRKASDL